MNKEQLLAARANIEVLLQTGAELVWWDECPECGMPVYADAEHGSALCGYDGDQPFEVGKV